MNRPEHKKIQHFRLKIYAYAYNGVTVRLDNIVTNDLEILTNKFTNPVIKSIRK